MNRYAINDTVHLIDVDNTVVELSVPTPTRVSVSRLKDRFGCDALPDAEVLFESKPLPDMESTGGECHPIVLSFTGTPPFSVDYTFAGYPNQEAALVAKSDGFSMTFSNPGVYRFLSVSDAFCKRSFSDRTKTISKIPTARLASENSLVHVCEIGGKSQNQKEQLEVLFAGTPPPQKRKKERKKE
jgi:hypothetical protein